MAAGARDASGMENYEQVYLTSLGPIPTPSDPTITHGVTRPL